MNKQQFAFITGIAGQDGSFLTEFLIEKGYIVYGLVRRTSNMTNLDRLKDINGKNKNLLLYYGDMIDISSILSILNKIWTNINSHPNNDKILEIYNLAGQSHVKISFETPIYTSQVNAIGTLNLLEAIVQLNLTKNVKLYQAATSEMYGLTDTPQHELTGMCPQSPYAISKLFSYWIIKNYRDIYNMYTTNGILFNHESERRPENFVSRKITTYVGLYFNKKISTPLQLGNLYAKRDWGYAKDYVQAMWLILQQKYPDDYVVSTGKQYTVKQFVETAFSFIDVVIRWEGTGSDEKGYNSETNELLIEINPKYFRPTEVDNLQGDSTKANHILGWYPETSFEQLVKIMVDFDKCR